MSEHAEEFFVGYLPPPARLWLFVRWFAATLLVGVGIVAAMIALGQRDPGPAVWSDSGGAIVGTISESPYPSLRVSQPDGSIRTALLVSEGKVGAVERTNGLDGKSVKITGTHLDRGTMHVVEIADAPDSIAPSDSSSSVAPNDTGFVHVTLRGEIIDPKCFSGAMKPGDGKAHKACATLCIRGGIPPVFIAEESSGGGPQAAYVVTDESGRALTGASLDAILPFVADHVEVHCTASRESDGALPTLRIAANSIKRL